MTALIDNASELTTGGILVVLILKLVFDFLNARELKKRVSNIDGTQIIRKEPAQKLDNLTDRVSEIHEVLLAQPPRQSIVATLAHMEESMRDQVQRQKEAVHVLEEIRDVLKTHSAKLDDAKCIVDIEKKTY